MWLKSAGIVSSIMVLIALAITLLKMLIGLVGFISVAFKILVVLVFAALIVAVGLMILKSWKTGRKSKD
jgi:hypothetical protein